MPQEPEIIDPAALDLATDDELFAEMVKRHNGILVVGIKDLKNNESATGSRVSYASALGPIGALGMARYAVGYIQRQLRFP